MLHHHHRCLPYWFDELQFPVTPEDIENRHGLSHAKIYPRLRLRPAVLSIPNPVEFDWKCGRCLTLAAAAQRCFVISIPSFLLVTTR